MLDYFEIPPASNTRELSSSRNSPYEKGAAFSLWVKVFERYSQLFQKAIIDLSTLKVRFKKASIGVTSINDVEQLKIYRYDWNRANMEILYCSGVISTIPISDEEYIELWDVAKTSGRL